LQSSLIEGNTMQVYRYLRTAILNGELPADAKVSQVRLAATLGVSRSPLREALRLLQNEGLVHGEHNRRMTIATLDPDDLEELYALRLLVEPLGVKLTVPRLTDADLAALRVAYEETKAALASQDIASLHEPHRRFHLGLSGLGGPRLRRQIEDLWDSAERYRRVTLEPSANVETLTRLADMEHDAMLHAAERGDADMCARLVAQQLVRIGSELLTTLDPRRSLIVLRLALDAGVDTGGEAPDLAELVALTG
jgi:DNA-binding GntR family transcriptional regulator